MMFLLNTPFQKAHLRIPDFDVTCVTLVGAAVPGADSTLAGNLVCSKAVLGLWGALLARQMGPRQDSTRRAIMIASLPHTCQSDFGRSNRARQTDSTLAGSRHLLCLQRCALRCRSRA